MKLSVIIVNYNVKYFLEQCLYAVLKACRNMEAEIFVVDNNSTDGSKAFLESKFSTVKFIFNNENKGFAKANNQALAEATGAYILFLNPDTIVPEDCFKKCVEFLQMNPPAGALGVRMIDGMGNFLKESKRAFPSPITAFYKLMGLADLFPRSKIFAKYYLGHLKEDRNHEIDVVAGAFMMIPRSILNKTGGFDETFFMYGEDIDLSYRIQQAGFRNVYFSQTDIIHFKGESTRKGSLNYVRLFYKAMSLFVKKYYSSGSAVLLNFFIQPAILLRALFAAVGGVFKQNITEGRINETVRAIIVSNAKDFLVITALIQKSGAPRILLGRVDNGETPTQGSLGIICELPELIKKYKANEIIFCEGSISFKEIILIIQQLPKEVRTKFHASGSSSIIGSDSKNSNGEIIAPIQE